MNSGKIDGSKLKKAIDEFGSLEKAAEGLRHQAAILKKQNQQLAQEKAQLASTIQRLTGEIKVLDGRLKEKQDESRSLAQKVGEQSRQFDLFGALMAMIAGSPSAADSLRALIESLQELADPGWHIRNSPEEMRSLFVRAVLGDYLRCLRCAACGASFITNKEPRYKWYGGAYECPACRLSYGVQPDDSFLKAVVSEEQLENISQVRRALQESEVLAPLRLFLEVPCEFCGSAIAQWDERNVKLAVGGIGWGHTPCWNSSRGQTMEVLRALRAAQRK